VIYGTDDDAPIVTTVVLGQRKDVYR